jgi:hypothetical protein
MSPTEKLRRLKHTTMNPYWDTLLKRSDIAQFFGEPDLEKQL